MIYVFDSSADQFKDLPTTSKTYELTHFVINMLRFVITIAFRNKVVTFCNKKLPQFVVNFCRIL